MQNTIAALREALKAEYPTEKLELGSTLAPIINKHLPEDKNLKSLFGGLKNLIQTHFEKEITFHAKKGKDIQYKISFNHENTLPAPLLEISSREILKHSIDYLSDEQIDQIQLPINIITKVLSKIR
ncbi:hypothetical protein ACH5Y9_06325 [Methylomonas sp. BW4-1]|uniref:Uncharacterized protein n=1 Tax=Methylomonas koyamae TaxID=702114 RepID=A0A177N5T1_9GAMM|nr:hypothetical protein [Methylomonas koyamae]OAI12569.1 hypothetical protein A1507_18950 [Methylomonas koyamae]